MHFSIQKIIKKIDDNRKEYKLFQPGLRKLVTNVQEFSLEDRFTTWSKYCKKEHLQWIIHHPNEQFPMIARMVSDEWPIMFEKHENCSWDIFLGGVEEAFNDAEDINNVKTKKSMLPFLREQKEQVEKYCKNVDEFKEMLIETNFGSFNMDW